MADFSQQDVQVPNGGTPVPQAVAPVNTTASTVGAVGQGLSAIFGGLGAISQATQLAQQKDQKLASDKIVSAYAKKVTSLNAAYEQGGMSMADARRQQRAAYNTIISNYPGLTEDITKFNSTLASSEGLGDVLAKGNAVDQQIQADTKSATAAGFINPGMSQSQQATGLNQYRQQQHAINQLDFAGKQLEITQKQLSIQASQESIAASRVTRANQAYELNLKKNTRATQQATADIASGYLTTVQNKQEDIQARLDKGELTPEQALNENMKLKNDFLSITQQVRGAAGGEYVDSISKPIMDTIKSREDFYSGKISADVAQHQLDNATVRATLPIMSDPKVASVMAISKLVPGLSSTLLSQFADPVIAAINKNTRPSGVTHNPYPDPQDVDDAAGNKTYMDSLKDIVKKVGGKDPVITDPKGTMQDVSTNVNNLIKGMNSHAGVVENPKQMNQATDFLASEEFLQYQKMGGKIDAANLAGVQNIVETNYLSSLVPAIQQQWEQSKVVSGVTLPAGGFPTMSAAAVGNAATATENSTPSAVQYRWTGSGVVFQPAKGFEKNPGANAQARQLNKNLAGLINKTVHLRAHMEGSDDYTKYWKASEAEMFGVQEPGAEDGK
ncbi:hypothetical protein [Erwinia phage Pecta]|nr:hypothetical protein [Erwinia phage Pecta]